MSKLQDASKSNSGPVVCRCEPVALPTYEPQPADKNPMFLEKRVYQGSSGKVYPLPFIDRIAEKPTPRQWDAVHLENDFVSLMILPEIGGRIHVGQDKTNGYDFFYRQDSIKPALVGLAGPWISGGVEFNWAQHHRPSTFMPTDVEIEEHEDGSVTVWLSEHDPMNRMKGMHGVCLHPGRSVVELKVRVYNRTPLVQTFLWWANVAARVHEQYQSFFPSDVFYVADHAKRAMSQYPLCQGLYYGVDYKARGENGVPSEEAPPQFVPPGTYAANDLSWYANIPVPTSYMCMGTEGDFFGGYDHARKAGLVHVANHHISPGKKQWTWGNHPFGYAWDRNLSDDAGPYIELMAGVYTDNQPDFSFLAPGETKTWSQFWYPIQGIGPAQQANEDAALSLSLENGAARVGVCSSRVLEGATIQLYCAGTILQEWTRDLAPGAPLVESVTLPQETELTDLRLSVYANGREIIFYAPQGREPGEVPPAATEPPLPEEIESIDELYITGLHLEQYRHATRHPEIYWREALRRDVGDARCNNALGLWHLRRGEFEQAETHFRHAIERLTKRNPNPRDGEPYYNLGLALRYLGRDEEAYSAFYKAIWNYAWQSAGYFALAQLDCKKGNWITALDHLDRCLRVNAEHLQARNLRVLVLRQLGREAEVFLAETRALDPLDWWAQHLSGQQLHCNTQVRIDLALDYASAGFYGHAIEVLEAASPEPESGAAPMVQYTMAWLHGLNQNHKAAQEYAQRGALASPDYCFPSRLEDIHILKNAMLLNKQDARAPYYLGNLFYDRRRYEEAIALWEQAAQLDSSFSVVWRNLGIAYFNIQGEPEKARAAYDKAFTANSQDARLLYERDQLWKRMGESPSRRLEELERYSDLVSARDDLTIEYSSLLNATGQHEKALQLISARRFQPWEGGEGMALGQHVRTHLALGQKTLRHGDAKTARDHFEAALSSPENLGEAKHLLANQSDIYYWLGCALHALGEDEAARQQWTCAATFKGDFQEMSVRRFSELTLYSALSLKKLEQEEAAQQLLKELLSYAQELEQTPATIDYFATSLPTMLLFEQDLQAVQNLTATFLQAQALLGLGQTADAQALLGRVLASDPNHAQTTLLAQTLLPEQLNSMV